MNPQPKMQLANWRRGNALGSLARIQATFVYLPSKEFMRRLEEINQLAKKLADDVRLVDLKEWEK